MAVLCSWDPDFDFSARLYEKICDDAEMDLAFGASPLTSPCSSTPSSPPSSPAMVPFPTTATPLGSFQGTSADANMYDVFGTSPLTSPCSSTPSSPTLPALLQEPLPSMPLSLPPPLSSGTSSSSPTVTKRDRKAKHKASKTLARRKRRAKAARNSFGVYQVRARVLESYVEGSPVIPSSLQTEASKVDRKGFVAINTRKRSQKNFRLEELVGPGSKWNFRLIAWDGKTPTSITDAKGRVIGVLAGVPPDDDWSKMHQEAAQAIEERRARCVNPKGKKSRRSRRGPFLALQCGVSHGGGQTEPKNFFNVPQNRTVLEELNALRPFKRIAGFASAVMASHAPRLYEYYFNNLGKLFEQNQNLKKNFPSTIFPAATYNMGPQTVCCKHIDPGNLCSGWCSVTPFGEFDHTKGGHLVLWECKLVIQFPAGSTILLPSSIVSHFNTPIASHEKRYSFALYSSGALFRWVENSLQKSRDFYSSLSTKEEALVEAANTARWSFLLSLLPIVEIKEKPAEEG